MQKEFKYYLAIVAAILLIIAGAVWGGAMNVFGDTGAAWLGSVGTISTLAFLIYQNTSQAKEIREERQKREDHEEKQQEMWASQKELLSFQKFQAHKSEFHSILSQLEKSLDIEFMNREALYESIFTDNNFNKCVLTIDTNNECASKGINKIVTAYSSLWSQTLKFNSEEITNASDTTILVTNYYSSIQNLAYLLQLKFKVRSRIGNIYWGLGSDNFIANVFDPGYSLAAFSLIVERITSFCNYELPLIERGIMSGQFLIPFYDSFLGIGIQQLYKVDFEQHKPILSILVRYYKRYFTNEPIPRLPVELSTKITKMFFDNTSLIDFFSSPEAIKDVIDQMQIAYERTANDPRFQDAETKQITVDLRTAKMKLYE